jgi:hypothetical protein
MLFRASGRDQTTSKMTILFRSLGKGHSSKLWGAGLRSLQMGASRIKHGLKAIVCWLVVALFLWVIPLGEAQTIAQPQVGAAASFLADNTLAGNAGAYAHTSGGASRIVTMQLRTLHGGPFAHHWIQLEGSHGEVTIGYGPASIPFIDAGEVSVWDAQGNVERFSGIHILPTNFNYSKPPGAGHAIGKPILLTVAQSDALIAKERRRHFFIPYIPIFHDCRTFACAAQASVQGKSSLPCYLLLKGYW